MKVKSYYDVHSIKHSMHELNTKFDSYGIIFSSTFYFTEHKFEWYAVWLKKMKFPKREIREKYYCAKITRFNRNSMSRSES